MLALNRASPNAASAFVDSSSAGSFLAFISFNFRSASAGNSLKPPVSGTGFGGSAFPQGLRASARASKKPGERGWRSEILCSLTSERILLP